MNSHIDKFPDPGQAPSRPQDEPPLESSIVDFKNLDERHLEWQAQLQRWNKASFAFNDWTRKKRLHLVARSLDRLTVEVGGSSGISSADPVKTIALVLGASYLDGSIADKNDMFSLFSVC